MANSIYLVLMKLIFAQGNPEPDYTSTRHNVGFAMINALADQLGANWTNKTKFHAHIAETTINGEKVLLVKPTTFYNETGDSARNLVDFYKLNTSSDLLVIHDDLALPFGTIRVRNQGRDAGNNGIKSLNSHLGTDFHRIRIGIDNDKRQQIGDTDFVLAKFSADESKHLATEITPHVIQLIEHFCGGTIKITSLKTDI